MTRQRALEAFFLHLRSYISLSDSEQAELAGVLEDQRIKKKETFLNAGEVCHQSAFVAEGCLRGFTTDASGFDHVLQFAPPGWWIADMYSLLSGQPGDLAIDALENTTVLLLDKKDQDTLYERIPKLERFFRILTENSLVAHRQRVIESMSLSAAERYARFCSRYPYLIEHVAQKQIAAYIGVTPEFLSKLRSDWMKNKV
jgi:CRP-like cAMP-binding protein